jgi:hypothetical protein
LTTNTGNTAGTISRIFTQNQNFFTAGGTFSYHYPGTRRSC